MAFGIGIPSRQPEDASGGRKRKWRARVGSPVPAG